MKKIYILPPTLILSLFLGFGWNYDHFNQAKPQDIHTSSLSAPAAAIIPKGFVQEMIDQVDQARLLTDLRRLTGVEPICTSKGCTTLTGRETESDGLQWAKDYVYETLVSLHYSVEVLDWDHDGYADQNIIATKPGLLYPNEAIYFIAHLDGYLSDNPAADDDASGVVSLLELARVLSRHTLSRTVVIFFSTGEEHGSLGSYKFVEDYPERLAAIQYVVSVEMLGYDSNNDGVMEVWNGSQPVDFVQLLVDIIHAYPLGLEPQIVSGCT
jgi:Peptidase family M28